MRADRLVATLLLLQSRGRATAQQLAEELDVSVATARRDLEALATAGIPVYPRAGRGGGWSLVGGARTDLSGLTAPEAQALFRLVGPGALVSAEAKTALRKLVQALPGTFRADAEAAARAVLVDASSWGNGQPTRPALVDTLQTAVVGRRPVSFGYTNRAQESRPWRVVPLGLVDKDGVWYLVADTDLGERTFRLSRMRDTQLSEDVADRPVDFDLSVSWRRLTDLVEQRRSAFTTVVLVETRLVSVLRVQFGQHCHPEEELADGRSRVRLATPDARTVAQHLAGWGREVAVVEPESVRLELVRIGRELTAAYPGAPTGA